jgi:hypothetical protein
MAKTIPADEQVFMVSKSTNTTYSGSAALKAMNEWYTMADVANTVQPYKVFTALLTQTGGDDPSSISGTPLTVGVSYKITDANPGYVLGDFTNVGAPNNEIGTTFIATGTGPNSWGTNISLTYNAGAPVATVLENTIGNIWFDYAAGGRYDINSSLIFTQNKTTIMNGGGQDNGDASNPGVVYSLYSNENSISIWTYQNSSPLVQENNVLLNTPIEIRVYN